MNSLEISIGGRTHRGSWVAVSTEAIEVSCGDRRRRVRVVRQPPREAAIATLTEMVRSTGA
jgi:hypothetical protein